MTPDVKSYQYVKVLEVGVSVPEAGFAKVNYSLPYLH